MCSNHFGEICRCLFYKIKMSIPIAHATSTVNHTVVSDDEPFSGGAPCIRALRNMLWTIHITISFELRTMPWIMDITIPTTLSSTVIFDLSWTIRSTSDRPAHIPGSSGGGGSEAKTELSATTTTIFRAIKQQCRTFT